MNGNISNLDGTHSLSVAATPVLQVNMPCLEEYREPRQQVSRNYVTAYSADSVIVVGGGAGTLVEACVAYQKGKSIVALTGSGGTADKIAGTYLDDRKVVKVMSASTPREVVDLAYDNALNGKKGVKYFQSVARMI